MPLCYRFARKYGHSPEDSADAIQETFLAAYKALDKFDPNYKFSTWIITILLNRLSNKRRALRRARRYFFHDENITPDENMRAKMSVPTPQEDVENAELQRKLERAIQKLPHRLRSVFILFEIEHVKIKEIAEMLDIPEGTVMSRLHNARQQLRSHLQEYFNS